jgi:wobble nucleotide-excising tRNase
LITQIDIANFGSFQGLVWKNSVRDPAGTVQNFKKLNVIYGRNYSGKTTLSRIVRALQEKQLPPNFDSPSFTLHCPAGNVTQSQVAANSLNVRVYNRDFVRAHLSFLVDQQEGDIKTFAIVGAENNEIVLELEKIENSLGSVAGKAGLRYEQSVKDIDKRQKAKKASDAEDAVAEKLRRHANDVIKPNRDYGRTGYNINDIKADVKYARDSGIVLLQEDEVTAKKALLKEDQLPPIDKTVEFSTSIAELKAVAFELLQRKITPSKAIQELLNDSLLQTWVRNGMPHHRNKRDTCAFCRQPLPSDIWEVLDSHFSKESTDLESEIDGCLTSITGELDKLASIITVEGASLYAAERKTFEVAKASLDHNLKLYKADLKNLAKSLSERKARLFEAIACPQIEFDVSKISDDIKLLNESIEKSDAKTKTLSKDKESARVALRVNDVATFAQQANLGADETTVKDLSLEASESAKDALKVADDIKTLEKRAETLKAQQKDERIGAERVNNLLNHFFGHDGLKLQAIDGGSETAVKFQIMRSGKSAYNLSEGECSLVAFCYFMAKLDDADTRGKELVIYIDDPISSLDSNHIFFMYSVIETLIAKPGKNPDGSNRFRYGQLFISTHNLDFLKYLKRLSAPKEKHGGTAHFLVEKNGTPSTISPMPDYLREYVTEFNYLFHQIYKCRNAELAKSAPEPFFAFGNNLRKFMEAYLFYKFPCQDDANNSLERMQKFFGDDDTAIALMNRLSNELSHLEEIFDRSMKPVEIPEIPKLANFVLDRMYSADMEQYNSLLKSIGEPARAT